MTTAHYNTKTHTAGERFKVLMRCDLRYGILSCTEQSMLRKSLVMQMSPKAHARCHKAPSSVHLHSEMLNSLLQPASSLESVSFLYELTVLRQQLCVLRLSSLFWNTRTCTPPELLTELAFSIPALETKRQVKISSASLKVMRLPVTS